MAYDIRFNFQSFLSENLNDNQIDLTPVSSSIPLVNGDYLVTADAVSQWVFNGTVLFENVYPEVYEVQVHGPKRNSLFYINVPTGSGEINGNTLIVPTPGTGSLITYNALTASYVSASNVFGGLSTTQYVTSGSSWTTMSFTNGILMAIA